MDKAPKGLDRRVQYSSVSYAVCTAPVPVHITLVKLFIGSSFFYLAP